MKKYFVTLICFALMLVNTFVNAQSTDVEMAEGFRSSGKIYVVIAVVLVILGGIVAYLISMDKKITKLEKEVNK